MGLVLAIPAWVGVTLFANLCATVLKALGFPGVFPGGTTTSYPDVGAVQSKGATFGAVGFGISQ